MKKTNIADYERVLDLLEEHSTGDAGSSPISSDCRCNIPDYERDIYYIQDEVIKFKSRLIEVGNNLQIVIPKDISNKFILEKDQPIKTAIRPERFGLCACGRMYTETDKRDHSCVFSAFSSRKDALAAQKLLTEAERRLERD